MAAGDLDAAEQVLRVALAESQHPRVSLLLANLLRKRGRLEEAVALLAPAAETEPTVELLDTLYLIQYQNQDFAGAERTLERLIALAPGEAPLTSYQILAKLKATAGFVDEARKVMARGVAAYPDATDFVAAYAGMLPHEHAIDVLESHLESINHHPARLAYVLVRITFHRAALQRARLGLPAYGRSWPDTYQWPDGETLPQLKQALLNEVARGTKRVTAWLDLACVSAAEGDWENAETCLAKLRGGEKRSVADFAAFGSAFHAALDAMSEEKIFGGLVGVERLLSPQASSEAALFIGSDPNYFHRFTLPFLRQLEAAQLPLDVHVHLLDGTTADWTSIRRLLEPLVLVRAKLTAEASGAAARGVSYARQYYHAIRFVRLYEELKASSRPMFLIDADAQLLRDPRPVFALLSGRDLALRTTPTEFSLNLKMTATCVGIAATTLGLEFARRVAAYIIHMKNTGAWGWGVDQLALLSAYAHMASQGRQPQTLFLDDNAINDKVGDTGVIKFLSGIDKYGRDGRAANT